MNRYLDDWKAKTKKEKKIDVCTSSVANKIIESPISYKIRETETHEQPNK